MALPFALRPFPVLTAAASIFLCQCATRPAETAAPVPSDDSYWLQEPVGGEPKVVISLDEQRVALMKGEKLVGLSPISSGREGFDTRPGVFKVTEKDDDHRSSWYGAFVDENNVIVVEDVDVRKDKAPPGTKFLGAEMRYFLRFNGPIGLHQGYLPGYPASHGCIRVPAHMAHLIYEATPHGSIVEVKQNAGLIAMRPPGAPSVLTQQPVDAPPAPPPPLPTIEATTPPAMLASATKPAPTLPESTQTLYLEPVPTPTVAAMAPAKPKRGWFGGSGTPEAAPATKVETPPAVTTAPAPAIVAAAPPAKPKRGWFGGSDTAQAKPASTAKPAPVVVAAAPAPKVVAAAPAAKPAPGVLAPPPARVPPPGKRAMPGGLRPISPSVPGAPPVRMTLAPAGTALYAR